MKEIFHTVLEFLRWIIEEYWLAWLFFVVYTESFIQPVPVDPLILASAKIFPFESVFIILVLWVLLWSMTGYLLWKYLWEPVFIKIFWKKMFQKWHIFMEKWWFLWVVIAWITPIPYKIITWIAWIFEMNFWLFHLAALAWRIPRFVIMYYIWDKFINIF